MGWCTFHREVTQFCTRKGYKTTLGIANIRDSYNAYIPGVSREGTGLIANGYNRSTF